MINEPIIRQFAEDNLKITKETNGQLYCICPYCQKANNHFNIDLSTGRNYCFRCGKGGSFERLTKKVCGWNTQVGDIIEQYSGGITLATLMDVYSKDTSYSDMFFDWKAGTVELTDSRLVCKRALMYLLKRNIIPKYALELGFRVGVEGNYKNMLVLPIYYNSEVANLIARQIPPYQTPLRYSGPHKGEALMDKSELLFNFDTAIEYDWTVIVEGVFDAISLREKGIPVVALMGKEISSEQVILVTENWNKVVILLDGGFEADAVKIGRRLQGLTDSVYIASIDGTEDPNENVEKAIEAIKKSKEIEYF